MKKIFLYVLLVVSALSSCMKHDNLYTGEGDDDSDKKKEEYDKNFPVKDIDPKQDWNMAKQVIVNVTVNYGGEGEYIIKIYSENPRDPEVQAYLLGKYTVKDGSTNALAVDAVSGSGSVYVCCVDAANGSVMKKGEVENGKVTVGFGVVAKNRSVSGRAGDEWKEFLVDPIADLVKPGEGVFQEGKAPQGLNTLTSYEFVFNGEFVIYPVYGETDGEDEIGYYYYDPKSSNGIKNRKEKVLIENLQYKNPSCIQYKYKEANLTWDDWTFKPIEGLKGNAYWLQNFRGKKIRSKAFVIQDVPMGYRVGFYVKVGNTSYYSNKILNSGRIHSAVIHNDNNIPQYIGLEDNPNESGRDCNDIVFYVPDAQAGDTPPEVVDPEKPDGGKPDQPATWIIACEDLGSTGDYDFNDIVFGVSHVAGQEKAEVIPYAAGGTLPAHIYWNGEDLGEIHDLLGGTSTTTMINTNSKGKPGNPREIKVKKNFSISTNMGNFSLKIGDKEAEIAPPGQGKVPQMICVPGDWAWPKERTDIVSAYPDFGEWGANYNKTDWWKNSASGKVVQ